MAPCTNTFCHITFPLMKKKYLLLFASLFLTGSIFSQDTIAKPERNPNRFRMCVLSKIYYLQPGSTGDNFLSSANKGKIGFGTEINFFTVYSFHFGLGYNFAQYDVTDVALAGNVENTNVNNFFAKLYYKVPVNENFSVNPAIMAGQTWIRQRTGSKNYGIQDGGFIGLGVDAEYECNHWFALFAGTRYNVIFTDTRTSPQYQDFFQNLNQFNVIAGVRFGTSK